MVKVLKEVIEDSSKGSRTENGDSWCEVFDKCTSSSLIPAGSLINVLDHRFSGFLCVNMFLLPAKPWAHYDQASFVS